jgi:tripartite-type tricarboxylate transporter receptor subunit TctC
MFKKKSIRLGFIYLFLSCQVLCSPNITAQSWPNKPIKIIIPFPPGDSIDLTTRMITPKLTEILGQPIIVENMIGGSGSVGINNLIRSNPDGYTFASAQTGNLIVLPNTLKSVKYNPLKDIEPISLISTNFQGIVATPNAPFNNLKEMIAYAKNNPTKLTVATNGEGGYPFLIFEDLRMRAGFDYTHVPYKGSVQVTTDVISGQVQVGILGMSVFVPHIRSGKLKLLGITSESRPSSWQDAQLSNEVVPGFNANGWFGYVAPVGTSPEIIEKMNHAINEAMSQSEVVSRLRDLELYVEVHSPNYFKKIIQTDFERYSKIIQNAGLKAQ